MPSLKHLLQFYELSKESPRRREAAPLRRKFHSQSPKLGTKKTGLTLGLPSSLRNGVAFVENLLGTNRNPYSVYDEVTPYHNSGKDVSSFSTHYSLRKVQKPSPTAGVRLDFQEYAKPSRLLPATEVKVIPDASVGKALDSFPSGRLKSLYKVKLQTSKIYGSGLTDVNSGILLCLIDENGTSILQRLPTVLNESDSRSEDKAMGDTMHLQRGSVDQFAFEGPNLGRILAVWIGLESGQWRIAGLSLAIVHDSLPSSIEESEQLSGLQYSFEFEDVLLGDSGDLSMMEFRPQSVTALSGDASTWMNDKSEEDLSASLNTSFASNEESMKEYTDLKLSLLFYDTLLILAGSSIIAFFSTEQNAAYTFLAGGLFGFIYLLLLQRSVDGLEVPEVITSKSKGSRDQILGKLRGPISGLVLAFACLFVAVKYYSLSGEDAAVRLTGRDLISGMMGFLMCKVSVVLAAFKPLPLGLRENKQI
ncbi:uncharacterized protein LOC127239280 [Andrographis paniculata]|uniref:uncharacterized protein LOC127239280 n=1 Tax=Andrographis paniculata TaxID=175694 RepID=UPI0021E7FFEB|nr:uncharacterized protein LOC127239280 [Andrographis paniculata]